MPKKKKKTKTLKKNKIKSLKKKSKTEIKILEKKNLSLNSEEKPTFYINTHKSETQASRNTEENCIQSYRWYKYIIWQRP